MTDPDPKATPDTDHEDPHIDRLLDDLGELYEAVDEDHERERVTQTMEQARSLPSRVGSSIEKYTTRDMAESLVGAIVFSLPLLVEDGVFEIATHFVQTRPLGVPVFFLGNIVFIVLVTVGLLFYTDFRDISFPNPIFGLIPRRLVGVLTISFIVAAGLMILWGRTAEGDPSSLEALSRITVIWTAAAIGAALGDILPGESRGTDVTRDTVGEMVRKRDR